MSTSPLSPEDIRAAAEVHHELGPEYSDAVVASFLDKVDREIAARVDARVAGRLPHRPPRRDGRRALAKGVAIGACAGVLMTAAVVGVAGRAASVQHAQPRSVERQLVLPAQKLPPVPAAPRPKAPGVKGTG